MIAIVLIGDIDYCPYLDKYKKIFDEKKIEYEILFWKREKLEKNYPDNYKYYAKQMNNSKKKIFKLSYFLKFFLWINKNTNKYDKFVILDTLSGILLSDKLINKYSNKYIFDIRDYSYENHKLFLKLENKIIEKSYFTCISSIGFKKFLPQNYNYVITNNFRYEDLTHGNYEFIKKKKYGDTLVFTWIGSVRYYNHQVKIINKLSNDKRFEIVICGTGPDLKRLKEYVDKANIKNVNFTGKYDNNNKATLLSNVDIINNSYDVNVGNEVLYAISNKYYDGVIYRIPQLVEYGTYKHNLVEKNGIGIGIDTDDKFFSDKLYDYYFDIDEGQFNNNCNKQIEIIKSEEKKYLDKIVDFVNIKHI